MSRLQADGTWMVMLIVWSVEIHEFELEFAHACAFQGRACSSHALHRQFWGQASAGTFQILRLNASATFLDNADSRLGFFGPCHRAPERHAMPYPSI